jgi:anti-sigma B factor antagonist
MSQASALISSTATGRCAAPTPFACTWREDGSGAAWVHVAGELDLLTAPQLSQTVREAQLNAHMVVLDLRALTFMDCSGIHVVLEAAVDARRVGGRLILVRGPAHIGRLFTITRVCGEVEIFDLDSSEEPVRVLSRLSRTWAAA